MGKSTFQSFHRVFFVNFAIDWGLQRLCEDVALGSQEMAQRYFGKLYWLVVTGA